MLLYIVQRDDDIHSTHIPESILMNVAGHLLMFQRDWSGPQPKNAPNKYKAVSSRCFVCMACAGSEVTGLGLASVDW